MNERTRSVLFVEQFYWPEPWGGAQIPRDITTELARRGWQVTVVCGSEQYIASRAIGDGGEDPRREGVQIARVPPTPFGLGSFKMPRQISFCIVSALMLAWRRPALYVTQTNPPLVVPLIAAVARLRRRPLVIIAQDIYPEVVVAHGMVSADSLRARLLRRLFAWAYRSAASVVALGPVMSRRLAAKGVEAARIVTISNWGTGEDSLVQDASNQYRAAWGLNGCFVILYSGNLGLAHDIETPILALREAVRARPDLRLVFVGQGSRLAEARAATESAGITPFVQFRAPVPSDRLPHTFGLANLALITLRQGFEGLVVPSKLLSYMARGIPTLYVGPHSDAQELVGDSGGGACVANGAVTTLAEQFQRLAADAPTLARMGRAARVYYDAHLSRQAGLRRYEALLESVCGCGASAARSA